ncbi:MAG: AAA family ATPase [Tannerella sp.]|nr:AAA family ATPase [Tannerella sp.]
MDKELAEWKNSTNRKPLLLHGVRQAGKTTTVRELSRQFDYFIEINFEHDDREAAVRRIFKRGLTPRQMCSELSQIYKTPVVPGRTLLFLDEIQFCLPAFSLLNYFYEDYPALHVVAAGSLLSFVLQEFPLFGIGRIRSLSMHPFSFGEYLRAVDKNRLADALQDVSPENPCSPALHAQCVRHLIRFMIAGGMPEVVATHVGGGSWEDCQQVLDNSIHVLYDDFQKYKSRMPASRLHEVLVSVVHQTGGKFNYSKASRNSNFHQIKDCIRQLELGGIIYPVTHTSAGGFPLTAGMNAKFRKYLIMDTGIYHRILRQDLKQLLASENPEYVNKNSLAELFVGLELLKAAPADRPAQLYYWQNERQGNPDEVEYVVQRQTQIIPVEVKPGTKSAGQSMLQFLTEKGYAYGIRCTLENFDSYHRYVKNYPLYAAAKIGGQD